MVLLRVHGQEEFRDIFLESTCLDGLSYVSHECHHEDDVMLSDDPGSHGFATGDGMEISPRDFEILTPSACTGSINYARIIFETGV